MPARWDAEGARYRDRDGNEISREEVLALTRQSLAATADVVGELADRQADGRLSPADFGDLLWQETKDEYIRQYLVGIGGILLMTQVDWGSIGGMLKRERGYLDNFVSQLSARDDLAPGTVRNRARMYINGAGEAYERAYRRAIVRSGAFSEEYWSLGPTEHCPDCIDLNGRGWVPIGDLPTLPRAGGTQCKNNCTCFISYR